MDDRMPQRRAPWVPWAITSVVLIGVAIGAYMLGASREVVVTGDDAVRWHHHAWFPGWIFVVLFWVFFSRLLWWGSWGWPYRYYRPWRYRRYHPGWHDDERDAWEEWHRREHERMELPRGRGKSASGPSSSDPEVMT
jgi:hypothetical protein